MRVKAVISTCLPALALSVACLSASADAGQKQPGAQRPPQPQTTREPAPKVEPTPEPPAAKKNARPEGEADAKPEPFDKMTVEEMGGRCVTFDTEAGEIVVEVVAEAAPETARNFLNLAATGAFDTTTFSRVVKDFVVQGGNIATREKVTPELLRRAARKVPDEPNEVKHLRGVVSLARPAEDNSATTHFFILLNDSPHLDGNYAGFGRVTSGMEAVDKIAAGELDDEKPRNPVRIRRATVARCVPPPD
ncbi:MAG TPA: peptidylprolyl isomerase [Pyrinomonadaceae bacterium]|jgi:peptidyl-prolyl cis-trans isomerase B (cyclophilin B)